MVSFSCENCGDVLTKKKLDPHRNQCYGASYTCLDCMVHFQGTSYRSHTSCISEDQKYQGKLYKEKKPKGQQQKNNSSSNNAQQNNDSKALVPRNAYVEDAPDTGAVAIVDAPPRAPSPPPASRSLGYEERAALPDVNVFDFLDTSETPNASRVNLNPVDESRMIEDSIPPAYEEHASNPAPDALQFQAQDEQYNQNGYTYGEGAIPASNDRHDSFYLTREQEPNFNFTTPAPKVKHTKSRDKDPQPDTTSKKSDRKRKRNSPAELDMSLVRAQQDRDVMMSDAPPMLHSGLTGGLNRLLARPEFPPSPELSGEYVENSPLSPMKRAKQGTSKALMRAQREWEIQQEKERKAEAREELQRERQERKEKERGRERERKERKASTALVKIKPKKRRDDSARASRRLRRRRGESSSVSPDRERKGMKAIEYHAHDADGNGNTNGALILRDTNNELTHMKSSSTTLSRAELFMSFITKGPESERGMSVNKALKRYHRERYERGERDMEKKDEEKELWKSLRLRRNERGEVVLFFEGAE
ncbi:uncharacterized protein EI97DRAFT_389005 [Westerdykella ornata]|uniref:Zinc finger C2H2 LYAR-type domain-containing protein n=1 Tax=Westerdykella ornata TaxID=318751 RepID=A0A6A6JYP6_WESOR|nr:uncharacterized protein EI97DRAFT_389005 [Westerdykella ornata]KAF2280876.1 hypothetical protein EI97DRAFT_389005 [Westerdykella ornata]